jgi:hypothetical protein
MGKLYDFFGGRKTMFALLLFVAVTVFLYMDKTDFTGWLDGIVWIFGMYAVGNGAEHVANGLKKK